MMPVGASKDLRAFRADRAIAMMYREQPSDRSDSVLQEDELLDLVLNKEVDAALVWSDMKLWQKARDLRFIELPPGINKTEEIQIAVLSTTTDKKNASVFADFVATEGRKLFTKHGFGEK